nr:hypothetical protein BaRGS_015474 [Batillaria attramentaria]
MSGQTGKGVHGRVKSSLTDYAEEWRSFFDAEVKLLQEEKNEAANSVNQLRTAILKTLNSSFPWNWSYLNSGSHYDGVKVTRPDEVDCMFFPVDVNQWLEVDYDGAPSEFCYIKLRKPGAGKEDEEKYTRLADLCELHEDDLYLSSTKYRDKIFEVFEVEIKKHRLARIDPDAKAGCPSFMVQLRVRPRGRGVPTIDLDLLPSLKLEGWPKVSKACLRGLRKDDKDAIKAAGFHVIPKQCKEAAYRKTKHLLWRLSYSAAEKHLTLHADGKLANPDGSPTCRKLVMRVLKRLLEIFKEVNNSFVRKEPNETLIRLQQATAVAREWLQLGHEFEVSKFSSFQIRTLMWNEYFKKTSPGAWANENRRGRLQDALVHMKDMLAGDLHVEHFFVPDLDIMKDVPRQEREFLYILFSIAKDLF